MVRNRESARMLSARRPRQAAAFEALETRQLLSINPTVVSTEFLVNSVQVNDQLGPAVTVLTNGNIVYAWETYGQDGDAFAEGNISARILTPDKTQVKAEFRVNGTTAGDQAFVSLSSTENGNWVASWVGFGQDGDAANEGNIYYRIFDSAGNPVTGELRANASTLGSQMAPDVAMHPRTGDFAVVWESSGQIVARVFNSAGAATTGEVVVSQVNPLNANPAVAVSFDSNDPVIGVAWERGSANQDIFARGLALDGSPLGGEFQINTTTSGSQRLPDVAFNTSGNFLVVYQSNSGDGNLDQILARAYDDEANALGNDFVVNTLNAGNQRRPAAAGSIDGRYHVVWQGPGPGGTGVQFTVLDAEGVRDTDEVILSTTAGQGQGFADISVSIGGYMAVVWESYDQEGDGGGIYATTGHVIPPDNAGNSRGTAWWIGTTDSGSKTRFEHVGYVDPVDFLRFKISQRTQLRFRLSDLEDTTIIQIQKSNGTVLQQVVVQNQTSVAFRRWMNAGTYFLRVSSLSSAAQNYKINITPVAFGASLPLTTPASAFGPSSSFFPSAKVFSTTRIADEVLS